MSKKAKSTKKYPMSDKEYLRHGGGKCPFCGSENLEGQGNGDTDGSDHWEEVLCLDCHKSWNDIYTLAAYAERDDMGHEIATKGKPVEEDADAKG